MNKLRNFQIEVDWLQEFPEVSDPSALSFNPHTCGDFEKKSV